jgi:hypothetical protein
MAKAIFAGCIGTAFFVIGVLSRMWIFAAAGLLAMLCAWSHWRAVRRQKLLFATYTFAWYQLNFPEHTKGDLVRCCACNSSQVRIKHLYGRTFHRKHFCGKCGETLYYTPE